MEVLQERRKGKPIIPTRKEVVALATTRHSHSGTDVERASDVRPEISKSPWHKRALAATATPLWVLAVVAVIAVIEYFVLLGTSMSVGKFGKLNFPNTLSGWLFAFSLVYGVVVAIMLVLRRSHRFASAPLRLLLAAVPVVLTIPLPAPLQSIYAWLLRNVLASTSVTVVDLFWGILGVVAIVLQAAFTIMLCRYVGDDGSLSVNRQKLDTLRTSKHDDETKLRKMDKRVETRKQYLDDATAAAEAATETVEQAADRRLHAQKAYDDMPEHKKLAELKADQEAKRQEYASAKETIKASKAILDKPKVDEIDRKEAAAELKAAENKREELFPYLYPEDGEENPHYLADKIASVEQTINTSDEKEELEAATAAHTEATTAQASATEAAKKREDEYDEIVRQRNEEASVVQADRDVEDQLASDIEEANKADKSLWRDIVFFPAVTIACALFLYSAWYGYVLAHLR